jgi:hypothetical protein
MSVDKFKPIVWAKKFNTDLEEKLVAYDCVNHEYEGLATQPGDSIKILGLGEVETHRWGDGKLHRLPDAQEVSGLSQTMPINQIEYFRFYVDDLDKRQSVNGGQILSQYMKNARDKVAQAQDSYILAMAKNATVVKEVTVPRTNSAKALMTALDDALIYLLENNVSRDTGIVAITPPKFNIILKDEYVDLDTNNSAMLGNGAVGRYSSILVKESNNVYVDETADNTFYVPVMTKRAISFVKPYIHMKAQEPDDYFHDEVKGYSLFDGMITRPKEIGVIKVKFSS